LSRTEYDLGHLFEIANVLFLERTPEDLFATLFLARFDKKDKSLIYASAGHPDGYVFNADGEVRDVLPSTGTLLGCFADAAFHTSPRIPLQSGDIVLMMTDGVLEARSPDGKPFGSERTQEVVRSYRDASAMDMAEAVCNAVIEFGQFAPQNDDMTVVVARVAE
jgi:sigma-B regulation protein RsbU (phosphoserine phosphatase)